jgi:hypothetical protein
MLKTVSAITNAIGALNYKGTWDASTNTPTLASGVGTKGDYYVVSVAGSTTLNGISNWGIGDWVAFNGSVWQRVEGGADLNGVNATVTGQAVLGGTTAVSNQTVQGLSSGQFGPYQYLARNDYNTAGKYWQFGQGNNNALTFDVYNQSGTGVFLNDGGTAWNANSDERLKTDLAPIENAAQKVMSLRAVTGRYKTDEESVSRAFLIAQDVLAVLPEAVSQRSDEMQTLAVAYTDVIPLLVAAIKELKAEIETLKGN